MSQATVKPKMKTTVTLRVAGNAKSHSLTEVAVRDLNFAIDEPVERGGSNLGPTPTDTALAALAGCTNVIGHKCAAKHGVDLGNMQIDIACAFDRRGVTLSEEIDVPFQAVEQTVTCDGPLSEAEMQAVADDVEKYCPLSKLFTQSGSQLTTTWRKA